MSRSFTLRPARAPLPTEIWVLVSAAFIIALGLGIIAPILPQFVVSFNVSMAAAGLVVAVFSASRLVFAPAAGKLVDAIGSRRIYLTGLFTVAVSTGLIALAQQYWHIVALRAIAGLGSTMFSVSAMGLIFRIAPPHARGRASATYASAFLFGGVFGPVLGSVLSPLGMRWPFFIYGLGVALAAIVVMVRMPRVHSATTAKDTQTPMLLAEAMRDSAYRCALGSNLVHGWMNMGLRMSVLPLFAASLFHHGGAVAGFVLTAFALGNALCLQISGSLSDTFGRKPLIMTGLIGGAVFTGSMGLSSSIGVLIVLSVVAGVFAGLLNPSQQAVVADIIGNDRRSGSVLSTYQMAMDAGQILGPIVVGMLADAFGFRVAFASCAVVAFLAAALWSTGRETLGEREASRS